MTRPPVEYDDAEYLESISLPRIKEEEVENDDAPIDTGAVLELPRGLSLEEMAKSGTEELMRRAYTLAVVSNNLKDVLAVAKEFADRGYGKVVDKMSVDMTMGVGAVLREIDGRTTGIPKITQIYDTEAVEGDYTEAVDSDDDSL